ncbi:hypothetical protein AB0M29_15405 [Streptomyces sp. NPDC051976]|uniref:hypothetical protein n=1 Tax=Streptomyces sp. NPDC051976 TaxID=3154947 RepID=UPI0034278BC7
MSREEHQDSDVQELRRLLAVPAERDFPAGRRIQREEHLMRGVRTMNEQPTTTNTTSGRRRRIRKRFAWSLAAAAVAAGAALVLPNGTQTPAYAVEKNPDGTLTVSLRDLNWSGDPHHFDRLAAKIRAAGFTAVIEKIPSGESCQPHRGIPLPQQKYGHGRWDYRYVMTHADTYLVEDHLPDGHSAHFFHEAFIKGPTKPCHP